MKRKGTSSLIIAALFIVGIIIGAAAVYALRTSSSSSTTTATTTVTGPGSTTTVTGSGVTTTVQGGAACFTCLGGLNNTELTGAAQAAGNLTGTFTIGVLDDLTDGLSGEGLEVKATTGFALQDINAWIQTTPLAGKVTITSSLVDYASDNTKGETAMNSFLTQGIHIVVGPLNSGTAGALLPFANTNHVVMISPSSTSPTISIPGDYLFRTPPADPFQAQADTAEFKQSGIQDIVIVYRQDSYGAGLANATAVTFQAAGGHVEAQIPYDTTTSNFVPILSTVNDAYNSAVSKYGATHVGLYFISFAEFGEIATQAASNYPSLLKTPLPWFGTDGEGNEAPIVNSTYASTVVQTRLAASYPGFTQSALTNSVCARQLASIGILCDGYSTGAYDDMWLATLSLLYCHGQNGACMQEAFPAIAAGFAGATGVTVLNAAGDRLLASYVFFCIVPGSASGTAKWVVCGTWDQASDTVTWSAKPSGIP